MLCLFVRALYYRPQSSEVLAHEATDLIPLLPTTHYRRRSYRLSPAFIQPSTTFHRLGFVSATHFGDLGILELINSYPIQHHLSFT